MAERPTSEYPTESKIFTLENVPFNKDTTTLVTGYFDLVHAGHVQFLRRCREIGNPLVVGIRAKGVVSKSGRPILTDQERLTVVSELGCVDYIFLDEHGYNETLIDRLRPKTLVFSSGERVKLAI